MRWFIFDEEGARLPWEEWRRVAADPEDMMASIALGDRAYRACIRVAKLRPREEAGGSVTAFAHILHHMLDEMGEDAMLELRYRLQQGWSAVDPGLWETPDRSIWPIGGDPRTELLSLRHCMERVCAPDLARLSWAAMTAAGRGAPLLTTEPSSIERSLMVLDRMRVEGAPRFLDEEERAGMDHLRSELSLSDRAFTDEILQALGQQRYFFRRGKVFIQGTFGPGSWYGAREVLAWRRKALQACSLLLAFRAMFLAAVTGESGPLRVSFPD